MNKKIFYILIIGILVTNAMAGSVAAQTTTEISYPIAELGYCADKTACKIYCDKSENVDACLSFAKKNNLMTDDEIKTAKNFKNTNMTGPGGCSGKDECKTYCSGPDHMDECIAFAEKNGMMSGKKLEEAKKVKGAIAKGIKPPACGGKEACDAYCSSSEHVEECVNFGEASGIISKEDAEKIRKGPDGKKGQGQGNKGNGSGGKNPDGQQGQGSPGGQGNEKQRPPQGKRQGQGQGGQGDQNNGGPGLGDQQQSQGSNGKQNKGEPGGQQGPEGPGEQNQNQDGPGNGGQPL